MIYKVRPKQADLEIIGQSSGFSAKNKGANPCFLDTIVK